MMPEGEPLVEIRLELGIRHPGDRRVLEVRPHVVEVERLGRRSRATISERVSSPRGTLGSVTSIAACKAAAARDHVSKSPGFKSAIHVGSPE